MTYINMKQCVVIIMIITFSNDVIITKIYIGAVKIIARTITTTEIIQYIYLINVSWGTRNTLYTHTHTNTEYIQHRSIKQILQQKHTVCKTKMTIHNNIPVAYWYCFHCWHVLPAEQRPLV